MTQGTWGLDRSLATGIAWTGGIRWVTQLTSWAVALLVARWITPNQYGLFAMAMVYAGLVQLFNELGLGMAIIQHRQLTEDQIARLGGMAILLNGALVALSVALARPIAAFFGEAAVRGLVVALSVTFVLRALQLVPRSLLIRDLKFRMLAVIEASESLLASITTVVGALLGWGAWALVGGSLLSVAAVTVALTALRPHRVGMPRDLRSLAGAIRFGGYVFVAQVCWYIYSHADLTLVGRVLGKAALGAYSKGSDIASLPVDRVSVFVNRVTPAVFSAAQDDIPTLRRYLLGLTEALALVTFPLSVGMVLVADLFVVSLLGPRWQLAITPLRVLALYGGFRAIQNLLPQMLIATGHAKMNMRFNILMAVALPVLFYAGTSWGTTGVAFGWIISYPLVTIPTFFRLTLQVLEIRPGEYLRALWPALSASAGLALVVLTARASTPPTWPLALQLATCIGAGAAGYAAILFLLHRSRLTLVATRLLQLLRTPAIALEAEGVQGG